MKLEVATTPRRGRAVGKGEGKGRAVLAGHPVIEPRHRVFVCTLTNNYTHTVRDERALRYCS
jgi:hypothetical protein